MNRDERRALMVLETQLAAGQELVRADTGLMLSRQDAQIAAAAIRAADRAGGTYNGHERLVDGRWYANVLIPIGDPTE